MNYVQLQQLIQDYSENTEQLFIANIPKFVEQAETRIYNFVNLPSLRKNVTGTMTSGNQYLSLPNDWLSNYSIAVINPTTGGYTYLLNKDVNFIREAYPYPVATGMPKYYALFGSQYGNYNEMALMMAPTPDSAYNVELHYFYYPPTIVQGQVSLLGDVTGGSLYTNGLYQNIPLTGGSGQSATADIVIVGGVVVSCTLKFGGQFYITGDVLSADPTNLGGSGSGFTATVGQVSNASGTSWLGDNFDSALLYGTLCEAGVYMKSDQTDGMYAMYQDRYVQAIALLKNLGDGKQRGDAYLDGQVKVKVQ